MKSLFKAWRKAHWIIKTIMALQAILVVDGFIHLLAGHYSYGLFEIALNGGFLWWNYRFNLD
jgi:hypothetical protein